MTQIIIGTTPAITYTFHTDKAFETMYEGADSDTAQSGTGA